MGGTTTGAMIGVGATVRPEGVATSIGFDTTGAGRATGAGRDTDTTTGRATTTTAEALAELARTAAAMIALMN